ncbi:MAG TPA: hypothetical protein VFC67_16575 [Prolixibacteraceae bacterium]|nr:hypothetical protein [Prolixibacteraceae bacterium]
MMETDAGVFCMETCDCFVGNAVLFADPRLIASLQMDGSKIAAKISVVYIRVIRVRFVTLCGQNKVHPASLKILKRSLNHTTINLYYL